MIIGETIFGHPHELKVDETKRRNNLFSTMMLILSSIAWGMGTGLGLVLLFQYQTLAGADGNPATHWPIDSPIARTEDRALLLMVVHPRCPCTRSSLEALARIMARCQDRVTGRVLFVKAPGVPAGWERTDLWHSAAAIPGIEVVSDDAGIEAARLGLETSGHVLLFDRMGQQRFSGGITAGRGHHGDNAGLAQCIAVLNGQVSDVNDTPVFGCSLFDSIVCRVEEGKRCPQCK